MTVCISLDNRHQTGSVRQAFLEQSHIVAQHSQVNRTNWILRDHAVHLLYSDTLSAAGNASRGDIISHLPWNEKGLPHFSQILHRAETELPNSQRQWFYDTVLPLTEQNLVRVKQDLDWLIAKYDYRNAGADWGNSRDALQRAMQKLGGGHVADKPFKGD